MASRSSLRQPQLAPVSLGLRIFESLAVALLALMTLLVAIKQSL